MSTREQMSLWIDQLTEAARLYDEVIRPNPWVMVKHEGREERKLAIYKLHEFQGKFIELVRANPEDLFPHHAKP